MKNILVAVILFVSLYPLNLFAGEYSDCFKTTDTKWGTHCGNEKSFQIWMKNTCDETLDIKYAIQRPDGKWSQGVIFYVDPGEIIGGGAWSCLGTGRYKWWARPSNGSNIKFPSNAAVNERFK